MMIFFHLFYDLDLFKFVNIDFQKDTFWFVLPRVIVTLFLFSVGMSLALAHKKGLRLRPYLHRLAKIGIGALLISLFTYFAFPKNWIYFGTLHCIFFLSIICVPFLKFKKTGLIVAIFLLALEVMNKQIPFFELSHASMDYIPIFPWLAVSLIGIYCSGFSFYKAYIPYNNASKPLVFLGQHAFKIYIIHQPILFGIVYLISVFMA
ncbi:PF07786 family protein [Bacteriovorax sp. Seq25_V]|nr:PF07786 family protein [Bacteriovorax sp. Seq25_V]